jgi:protein TonB
MPVVKREVKPSYTMEAMRAKEQGKVFLEALILPDGSVRDTRVLVGFPLENGLNQSAVAAVRQWQFEAGRASGKPAPVVVTIELQFTLK